MSTPQRATRPKDSDLRQAAHRHGARSGTKLWSLLTELQRRRNQDPERAGEAMARDDGNRIT